MVTTAIRPQNCSDGTQFALMYCELGNDDKDVDHLRGPEDLFENDGFKETIVILRKLQMLPSRHL